MNIYKRFQLCLQTEPFDSSDKLDSVYSNLPNVMTVTQWSHQPMSSAVILWQGVTQRMTNDSPLNTLMTMTRGKTRRHGDRVLAQNMRPAYNHPLATVHCPAWHCTLGMLKSICQHCLKHCLADSAFALAMKPKRSFGGLSFIDRFAPFKELIAVQCWLKMSKKFLEAQYLCKTWNLPQCSFSGLQDSPSFFHRSQGTACCHNCDMLPGLF